MFMDTPPAQYCLPPITVADYTAPPVCYPADDFASNVDPNAVIAVIPTMSPVKVVTIKVAPPQTTTPKYHRSPAPKPVKVRIPKKGTTSG